MAAIVPSVIVNLEALDIDNYEYWSFRVETYLLAEDLWDLVEGTDAPPKPEDGEAQFKDWRKKNAKALHSIIIACGKDAESFIRGKKTARDAWTTLAETFADPENSDDEADVFLNNWSDETNLIEGGADLERQTFEVDANHETFFDSVDNHDWEDQKVLHRAIWKDDLDTVKELSSDKELLLCPVDPSSCNSVIPLSLAMSCQKPKLARYLYSVTPIERLERRDRAQLVSIGLQFKILDIPFHILRRYPYLVLVKDHSGESPLSALASTRFGLFLDTSNLPRPIRFVYKGIVIPPARTPARMPRPTYFVKIDLEAREEEKNQGKVSWFIGKLRHLFGMDGIYQMKLLHKQAIEILDCMCSVLNKDKDNLKHMQHKFVVRAIFQAVEQGNVPFIKHIVKNHKKYPWISSITNQHDKTVFQFAAEHRQAKIFDLMSRFDKEKVKEFVSRQDKFRNNMLHVVGKLAPLTQIGHIRGTALQMQNELQCFKKVERLGNPNILNCINSAGHTPREEFTKNHRNLVEAGEKSMKETATSSSALVAALIITIMFAAAVTVPGAVNGDTGIPIHLHTKAFRIFMVADVVSLCFSTTSVMIFLGIHTSRFSEEDFLRSLPTKLIIGFLTLFISIGAMMVAFSSAIFIMLPENSSLVIPSIILAGVPIASFLWMQIPFLVELIISTYELEYLAILMILMVVLLLSPALIFLFLFILICLIVMAFHYLKRFGRKLCNVV